jgi:DNA-binding transcriptional MerR regulator/methylmalonyl-CoA mutase cobalamin-binding subunit
MYTIKQAAARTGVAVPTIRAWERRYGIVDPARTPAGYRLYDEADLERLAGMRHLVEAEGWRPSQAAERVKDPATDLQALLATALEGPGRDDLVDGTRSAASPPDAAIDALVDAATRVDVQALDRILDETFASQRFELAMGSIVFPALRGVGQAWAGGQLDVAAEHAASETVRRRLARFFDASRGGGARPQVVIGMPPAGQHELGAFAFAVACRRAGLEVLYLGSDVPLESWVRTVRETGAPAVVLGAVAVADAEAVGSVVDAISATGARSACFVGGPAASGAEVISGAVALPASLDAAVLMVAAAVQRIEGTIRAV